MKPFLAGLAAFTALVAGSSVASAQYVVYPAAPVVVAPPPPPPVYAPGVAVSVGVPGVSVTGVVGGPPGVAVGVGLGGVGVVGGLYRPFYGHPYYGPHFHGYHH